MVDPAWLAAERHAVVLADVRWYLDGRPGRAAYEADHLPGAIFVDLEAQLSGPDGPDRGRHPLPEPDAFAAAMTSLGIGDDVPVVAYDDQGGVVAARLVWMLRVLDHPAALLDGGLEAGKGAIEPPGRSVARRTFTPRPWPAARLAGIAEASDRANVVLDARARARFRGDEEPVDHRAGHIPGARSAPCHENLGADGRFLPVDQRRRRFVAAGVGVGASVVAYCGSGVSACHDLLALEHAGLGLGRLYPGSWSHYSQVLDRPVATGEG